MRSGRHNSDALIYWSIRKIRTNRYKRALAIKPLLLTIIKELMGDNWSTPDPFFNQLNEEFRFNLDVCASDWNHKCANYFTEADNALERDWPGVFWMNPPFSTCGTWVKKAFHEVEKGSSGVCLIPARVETNWFHDYCIPHEIRFVKGRIHFFDEYNRSGRPRFGCVLVVMRPFKYDSGIRFVIQPKELKIN